MQKFNKQEIFWHSRRGMLELDLLLVPFAQEQFEYLNYEDQTLFNQLLQQEDQDLWLWLLGQSRPTDPALSAIIEKILAFNKSNS